MSDPTHALHQRLLECARQVRAVDVRPFELRTAPEALRGLVPPVLQILELAIAVCRDVLSEYDPEDPAGSDLDGALGDVFADEGRDSSVFHVDVDMLVDRAPERRQVADVAFLGVTELRPKVVRIERLHAEHDPWEIVAECGSALRRIEKTLTAVEVVLCRSGDLRAELSFASRLTRSLQVRQQYARLRQAIGAIEFSEATQHRSLRLVGTAIAVLIGKDVYPDLRIHDRRQLRELQERILSWLRQDGDASERGREAQRLWQDLVGFAGLLALVSRRQELIEHDATLVGRAYASLHARDVTWAPDLLDALRAARGLDDEMDRLLDSGETTTAAWAAVVRRLYRTICEPTGVHPISSGHGGNVLEERRH